MKYLVLRREDEHLYQEMQSCISKGEERILFAENITIPSDYIALHIPVNGYVGNERCIEKDDVRYIRKDCIQSTREDILQMDLLPMDLLNLHIFQCELVQLELSMFTPHNMEDICGECTIKGVFQIGKEIQCYYDWLTEEMDAIADRLIKENTPNSLEVLGRLMCIYYPRIGLMKSYMAHQNVANPSDDFMKSWGTFD